MKSIIFFLCTYFLAFLPSEIHGQNAEDFIYGTITTHSGERYTGFMRWGKEEMFWHDIFNSEKIPNNKLQKQVKEEKDSKWSNFDWNFRSIWEDKYRQNAHTFACYFGDIHSLKLLSDSKVDLILKNGEVLNLIGGSNDIGATISLEDYELGTVKIAWSKIRQFDFQQAPSSMKAPQSYPLYGRLSTKRSGTLQGYIKWDLDERCSEDILDGDSNIGDQQIPFRNILAISKKGSGSVVTLQSGRTLFLNNSNDVNEGNRGIEVYQTGVGSCRVPWSDFIAVELSRPKMTVPYSEFERPTGILAEVMTFDGNHHEGLIVFDIDEAWELELLDGNDEHIEYQIPFRNISQIHPKNKDYSIVYLHNGTELLLGDKQDVSFNNDGILVFGKSSKDPKYIAWENIDEIIIKCK
jgi:hypothetical protein